MYINLIFRILTLSTQQAPSLELFLLFTFFMMRSKLFLYVSTIARVHPDKSLNCDSCPIRGNDGSHCDTPPLISSSLVFGMVGSDLNLW
jgi:hypothetical protein